VGYIEALSTLDERENPAADNSRAPVYPQLITNIPRASSFVPIALFSLFESCKPFAYFKFNF
jgi:hypothetical protein